MPSPYRALSLAVAGALLASGGACPFDREKPPSPPADREWTLEFQDRFDGPAGTLPARADWRFSIGHGYPGGPPNWGTGEVAYHTDDPANVSLDGDGNLRITPLRDYAGNWTSARIETNRQDFRPPPGGALRIESRLRLPDVTGDAALGYWPAFWSLGAPYRDGSMPYPEVGEIDFMEHVNGVDAVWMTLHCGSEEIGRCGGPSGIGTNEPCPGEPCPGSFHRFTVDWDTTVTPNELRWYVDGELLHQVSQADVPAAAWDAFASHDGFFLLLNVAIGGGLPDAIAGRTTPTPDTEPGHPMLVDYVAVWSRP